MEFDYENGVLIGNIRVDCGDCRQKFLLGRKAVRFNFIKRQIDDFFGINGINFGGIFKVKKKLFAGLKKTILPFADSLSFLTGKSKRKILALHKDIFHSLIISFLALFVKPAGNKTTLGNQTACSKDIIIAIRLVL